MAGQIEKDYNFNVSSDRKRGYLQTLARNGIDFNPAFELTANFDSHTAELGMDELLTRKKLPTAIFCESDEMAFGVLQSLREKGLRVPEDISVIGYDNHEYSNVLGLTTIAQPVQFLGQLAATQIMAKIEKTESQLAQIKVPTNLVVRDSVAEIN
jgi:DNA-binding LacI/PurR family transcriptional regulator